MRTIFVVATENFARNIQAIRNYKGWTREYFCEYYKIEPWMLERIENGDPEYGFDMYLDSVMAIEKDFSLDDQILCFGDLRFD